MEDLNVGSVDANVAEVLAPAPAVVIPVAVADVSVAPVSPAVAEVAPVATVAEPVKAKRGRKPGTKVAKKSKGRGRPAVFVGDTKKGIVKLLKSVKNATHVRAILCASAKGKKNQEYTALRVEAGITERTNISMPTLLKLAENAGITLERGRPVVEAA